MPVSNSFYHLSLWMSKLRVSDLQARSTLVSMALCLALEPRVLYPGVFPRMFVPVVPFVRKCGVIKHTNMAISSKFSPHSDDIVIVATARTPIAKHKGFYRDTFIETLFRIVLEEVLRRTNGKVTPEMVDDVVVGSVLGFNTRRLTDLRVGQLLAGFPPKIPTMTVNRKCASGLQAVANVASAIQAGHIQIGIAAGAEKMTGNQQFFGDCLNPEWMTNEDAKACLLPMGMTSENVAKMYGITREDQDRFAAASYEKALRAIKSGKFRDEIVPVKTIIKNEKGETQSIVVENDEGPRPTSFEKLQKLKPAFSKDGCSTAGNSSQVSDGAAAVILMKRSKAQELGLTIQAVFQQYSVVGVPPAIMGVGPAYAIPALLKKVGLTPKDIDVYEINEAFASQALFSIREAKIPADRVNPNGGAIALGHPLGCTGSRMIGTLINELHRRKAEGKVGPQTGIISMCIGSGMGAAALLIVN